MNGSVITREFREFIRPLLKQAGFDVFSTRTGWRHRENGIDVINLQSFTRDVADGCGVTTFSFALRLGWFPAFIPPTYPPPVKNGKLLPEEAGCDFRHTVERRLAQPGNKHLEIWHVYEDGSNLAECIGDVEGLIPECLKWFDRYSDERSVLRLLLDGKDDAYANDPSPKRSYLVGYAAYRCGDMELARIKLQQAVDSKCYVHLFSSVEGALYRAR